ncbi:hypothetical protein F4802DRAFT_69291 [Xylaria palmicola]|nr:hypothetical protein F4802DRAFT_69291 [Xylaria palmicola]
MADHLPLDLKAFEISSRTSHLSLSMDSVAFICGCPLCGRTQHELRALIQSKQLWLLPRSLCHLDIHVQLSGGSIPEGERVAFFDYIADAVYEASLWSQLNLNVEMLDIQYHREECKTPNLSFSIEQPDMSSALLSPPQTCTAHFKGLECNLRFGLPRHHEDSSRQERQNHSRFPSSPERTISSTEEDSVSHCASRAHELVDLLPDAAYLVDAALCFTFGTRKRFRGLSILKPNVTPSLLDLAPSVLNSHYLKSTVNHAKNFTTISTILASSLDGQSPALRRKAAKILEDDTTKDVEAPHQQSQPPTKQLERSIQRKLWDLLQTTLSPTIGTKTTKKKSTPRADELAYWGCGIDEWDDVQYELSYEHQCPNRNLSSLSGPDYDYYDNGPSYGSDPQSACQPDEDVALFPRNGQLQGAPVGTSHIYGEARVAGDLETDLSHTMQDHIMSDFMLE